MGKIHKKCLSVLLIAAVLCFVNVPWAEALTPASNANLQGIDVSDWQGYIDYSRVKESGIEIVYIKASQGSNYKDPYFDINYENAKANGLKVGFYHFLTATNTRRSRTRSSILCLCDCRKSTRL